MKISKRCEYALRALIDLGIARESGHELLQLRQLVESEKIPAKFLEQILSQLRTAGYLRSTRGKLGGYGLKKAPDAIVIGEVVRLMDGPIGPIACVSPSAYRPCSCPDENHCGLRLLMLDLRTAMTGVLDRYTLADVVNVTLRKIRRDKVTLPFLNPPRKRAVRKVKTPR